MFSVFKANSTCNWAQKSYKFLRQSYNGWAEGDTGQYSGGKGVSNCYCLYCCSVCATALASASELIDHLRVWFGFSYS